MSIKRNQRYLILHKVAAVHGVLTQKKPEQPPTFTRSEMSGEQASAFIRTLDVADDYEIYPLSSQKLELRNTVVCTAPVRQDETELQPEDLDDVGGG